jgi:hypothetical protein
MGMDHLDIRGGGMRGPCLDEETLSRIREDRSDAFLRRIIDLFLREAPPRLEEAWGDARAGDLRRLATGLHTLHCLAGNVGALAMGELTACAEEAAESGRPAAASLSRILFDLEIAFAETRACLLRAREGLSE